MRQEGFRRRRQRAWRELAQLLREEKAGRLGEDAVVRLFGLYRAAAADLAWAREHGSPDLREELNRLVAEAHEALELVPAGTWSRLRRFYASGLPRLSYRLRGYVWVAAALFAAGALAGFAAVHFGGPGWSGAVLPPDFQPAYHGRSIAPALRLAAASTIYVHNVVVTSEAFALGVFAGVPTTIVLFQNGLLLGGLLSLFSAHHLTLVFWSLILPHGVLELYAVFLGGAGGLRLGWAWLRPGDLARMEALRAAGRDAAGLLLAIVPLLGTAALIEGLVTPSGLAPIAKVAVGGIAGAALIVYMRAGRRNGG